MSAPQTSRGLLSVLSAAEREARDRQDEYVSTEHLLIALATAQVGYYGKQVCDPTTSGACPPFVSTCAFGGSEPPNQHRQTLIPWPNSYFTKE